jgi:hypothetical protein
MTTLWKIACEEHLYPGLWHHWFRSQSVAVGWPPQAGYHLQGKTEGRYSWKRTRKALSKMKQGDRILVALRGHRVARIGTILALKVDDKLWNPFVPKGPGSKYGEKGRRIEVKWDMELGPEDRELVIKLPEECRLSSGELRPTIAKIKSHSVRAIVDHQSVGREKTLPLHGWRRDVIRSGSVYPEQSFEDELTTVQKS